VDLVQLLQLMNVFEHDLWKIIIIESVTCSVLQLELTPRVSLGTGTHNTLHDWQYTSRNNTQNADQPLPVISHAEWFDQVYFGVRELTKTY
jgi:hypothetical protein